MNTMQRQRARIAAIGGAAAVCGVLTLLLAFDPWSGGSGTILASQAYAETAAHVPAVALAQEAATTETARIEPADLPRIFKPDPLQSLADSLRRKERELDEREAALAEREHYLETVRLETQQTLEKIEAIRKQMETIAAGADQNRQRQIKKWIEIFQKMTPDKVAPALADLELDFQLEILGLMEPGKAAKILNAFPPAKAAELGARLNR